MALTFPSSVRFRKSSAEVRLFGLLKAGLGDDWTVLHHVRWLQKEPGRNARDGEADFVLAHPEHGALVLEVKGGEVTFDAASGEWTSRSKKGSESAIKDPFDQAKHGSYALARHLRSLPGWSSRWGPIGYAVCLPDGRLGSAPLPHMAPVLIDADDLEPPERLEHRLIEICGFWRRDTHTSGEHGVARIVESLAHDVRIEHPLRLDVEEADREILSPLGSAVPDPRRARRRTPGRGRRSRRRREDSDRGGEGSEARGAGLRRPLHVLQ